MSKLKQVQLTATEALILHEALKDAVNSEEWAEASKGYINYVNIADNLKTQLETLFPAYCLANKTTK